MRQSHAMPPPVRVVFHIPLLLIGGAERNLYDLAVRLRRDRFQPMVWCSESDGPVGTWLRDAGIPVHGGPFTLEETPESAHTILLLRALGAHIFHSFSYRRDCRDVVAAGFAGIPIVITTRLSMRYWDAGQRLGEWERIRNEFTHAVVANASAVAAECARIEGIDAERLRVIRNGIAIPDQPRKDRSMCGEIGIPGDAPLLGVMANLRSVKGHEVLLQALPAVLARIPGAHVVFCGADLGGRVELERLCALLGLEKHVTFAGLRQDVDQVFAALDLYVQSSFTEGMSTAVLEAMARGVAVVATAVGGTPEAVIDGETGILVPPGDSEALAAAIATLLEQPALRERMGAAGRLRALAEFDIARVVDEHQQLYDELLVTHFAAMQ